MRSILQEQESMGLVPPMTPAGDDLLGQGIPPQTPHLGLDQLEHLHQLPAMENMGYDQVNSFFFHKTIS